MKILLLGDPHGSGKVKDAPFDGVDLILIPGDVGKADLMRKYAFQHIGKQKSWTHYESPQLVKRAYCEAYSSSISLLKFLSKKAPVYFVYGNVESSDIETKKLARRLGISLPLFGESLKRMKNLQPVNNQKVEVQGISLAGLKYFVETDWVRRFAPDDRRKMKAAEKETFKARKFLEKLPYVDILLCHQPPYRILDKVTAKFAPKHWQGKHAGSKLILSYINRRHPKYVVCGHIHEGKGEVSIGKTKVINAGVAGDYKIIEC